MQGAWQTRRREAGKKTLCAGGHAVTQFTATYQVNKLSKRHQSEREKPDPTGICWAGVIQTKQLKLGSHIVSGCNTSCHIACRPSLLLLGSGSFSLHFSASLVAPHNLRSFFFNLCISLICTELNA